MSRPRSLTDAEISGHLLAALHEQGEKALTFGVISKRCGLAQATLAQRYGTVDGMVRHALAEEWLRLSRAVEVIEAEALNSSKGTQALLKRLPLPHPQVLALSLRDEALQRLAEAWRAQVEAAIAARRGGGARARDSAALIFAAWQGRYLWESAGGKGFRLSDLLKAAP
jgi:AcrR family transcriptional regulator